MYIGIAFDTNCSLLFISITLFKKLINLYFCFLSNFIMPGIGRQVVEYCIDKKIPVIPNCITPGEMTMAVEYGLDMVKFFPIYQLGGLATLNEYTGAYPMLHFLVTGMLNETNFLPLLENRKVICGGDWMFTQGQALVNNDYALIARNLRESVYQAQDLRNRLAIRK